MKTEEQAHTYIGQRYGYTNYCMADDVPGQTFDARYAAIRVARFLRAPTYHIHEVRRDGSLGQRVEVIEFLEVRHVGA